jgi:hypothetical protein
VIRPSDALLTDNAGCCARMNKTFCTPSLRCQLPRTRATVIGRQADRSRFSLLGDTVEAVTRGGSDTLTVRGV